METVNSNHCQALRTDNQLLMFTHFSQLLTYVTGFGGLIVPLFIWVLNKDKVDQLNSQGKEIINFQLSVLLYTLICFPLILLLGLGLIGLGLIAVMGIVFPIINGIKAANSGQPVYPLTIKFI